MKRFLFIILVLGLLTGSSALQEKNSGIVSRVFDGDSLIVKISANRSVEIRLAEIDAPEKSQPYSDVSRNELTNLIGGEPVRIEIYDIDAYGRIVAHIYRLSDQLHVNAWMVGEGLAWVYVKYSEDEKLITLQKKARQQRLGLWSLPDSQRIPPWVYRRRKSQ
jgi:endonuclease YncB( thermonuclease family)